jgi:hypothetical protein
MHTYTRISTPSSEITDLDGLFVELVYVMDNLRLTGTVKRRGRQFTMSVTGDPKNCQKFDAAVDKMFNISPAPQRQGEEDAPFATTEKHSSFKRNTVGSSPTGGTNWRREMFEAVDGLNPEQLTRENVANVLSHIVLAPHEDVQPVDKQLWAAYLMEEYTSAD